VLSRIDASAGLFTFVEEVVRFEERLAYALSLRYSADVEDRCFRPASCAKDVRVTTNATDKAAKPAAAEKEFHATADSTVASLRHGEPVFGVTKAARQKGHRMLRVTPKAVNCYIQEADQTELRLILCHGA
jgi:hypothetical protein